MKAELDKALVIAYPKLYKHRYDNCKHTAMCWGFECGDGWYDLLDNLSHVLSVIAKCYHLNIVASQVKEKFGTLAFYYNVYPNSAAWAYKVPGKFWKIEVALSNLMHFIDSKILKRNYHKAFTLISDTISFYEWLSHYTCETCGKSSKLRDAGWIYNMCDKCWCDKCWKDYNNEKKKA